jgi:hypothetical protein
MEEKRSAYRVLMGRLEGKRPLESLDVDGKIILKLVLEKSNGMWIGFIWLRIGPVMSPCENRNKSSDSIKC